MMLLIRNPGILHWIGSAFPAVVATFSLFAAPAVQAQSGEIGADAQPAADSSHPFLGRMPDPEAGAFIRQMNQDHLSLKQRLEWITLCSLGTEYVPGPLGEGPNGEIDKDPLWDFQHVDCVTFLEQTYALALARDWQSFTRTLRRIRYRDGEVGFAARNHYTVPDWLPANKWLLRDITRELAGERVVVMEKCISKKDFFERSGLPAAGANIPDATMTTEYAPRLVIPDIADQLETGDMVIWMTDRPAIFASHVGMAIKTDRGAVVRHASKSAGKVTENLLADYARENDWLVGMKFARLHARTEFMTQPLDLNFIKPKTDERQP